MTITDIHAVTEAVGARASEVDGVFGVLHHTGTSRGVAVVYPDRVVVSSERVGRKGRWRWTRRTTTVLLSDHDSVEAVVEAAVEAAHQLAVIAA
jgi:hypothetical protein